MDRSDFSDGKEKAQKAADDFVISIKSASKSLEDMINDYRNTLPTKISVDLLEDDENYYLRADIPGAPKDTVNIEIEDQSVIITCEFESFKDEINSIINPQVEETEESDSEKDENVKPEKELKFLVKGRTAGFAKRIVKLPERVASKKSTAEYDNGTVTVTIPKRKPKTYNVTVE
ncbi:Hsp20/alpha crystallin family protein [Methanobrevibacter boviskoreani]|uniref:Hsp20/alpha crystallin family protein n=1 Tax=Methanobrevibacter boviskoreani TaxID=1348249 RepID=UPI0023A7D226|nr:Hsp20/alpha crystallin family protein [Methanobrevibacter boviskoreani]MCI6775222.1 Hsp20/alpha crystallin family protein [Methanobrevibacter boviskoreani]MDY5614370.1 Hsp20/alpha crystallin family protein [Methanobrevibacter boviskoreani]